MKQWLISLVALGGLMACGAEEASDGGEAAETQAQVTSTDAGAGADAAPTSTPDNSGNIGSSCVADTDCKAAGTTCRKEQALPFGAPIPFAGGLCTKACKTNTDCGTGAACPLAMAEAFLPGISVCLKPCKVASDCREGYRCASTSIGAIPGFGGAAPAGATPPTNYCLPPSPGLPAGLPPGGAIPGIPGLPTAPR